MNVYGYNRYLHRIVTFYDPLTSDITGGPVRCLATLGQSRVRFPFVSQKPIDGNFSPRSLVWSAQFEQPIIHSLKVRATYLLNYSDGLVL